MEFCLQKKLRVLLPKEESCKDSSINKENYLFVDVDIERYQERNRTIALQKIESRIINVLKIPKKKNKNKALKKICRTQIKIKKNKIRIKT